MPSISYASYADQPCCTYPVCGAASFACLICSRQRVSGARLKLIILDMLELHSAVAPFSERVWDGLQFGQLGDLGFGL